MKNCLAAALASCLFFQIALAQTPASQPPGAPNLLQIGHLRYDTATLAGCWHHVDSLGNEYALVGTSRGLSIVDLSNPARPRQRFHVPGITNNWREVKTWGGFAYVGSEALGSGITIVDLRHLPDTVFWKTWTGDGPNAGSIISSHTVACADGYLYVFGGSTLTNGAVICDLSDAWNPTIVGTYTTNYLHDGLVRGDTLWGNEIYAGQFSMIDISDKANPILLQTQPTPAKFNHNGWLSDDGRTFFTTDERADAPLAAFDVADFQDISLLDTYFPSKNPSREVHNVRGLGNFLICPSYGGQLTIVDATHPDNLIETAFASLGTSLVWDADPYLPSGIVFATAKNEGLFIFKPTYQQAAYLDGRVTNAATGEPLAGARVRVVHAPQTELSRADGTFKTGAAEAGRYTVVVEKEGYVSQKIAGIWLKKGQVAQLDVALQPRLGLDGSMSERSQTVEQPQVSPTIFSHCLMVEIPSESQFAAQGTTVRLADLSGKTVLLAPTDGLQTEICIEGALPAGQYLVFLENGKDRSAPIRVVKS